MSIILYYIIFLKSINISENVRLNIFTFIMISGKINLSRIPLDYLLRAHLYAVTSLLRIYAIKLNYYLVLSSSVFVKIRYAHV